VDGSRVYLGLSERNDRRVLRRMRLYLSAICLFIVLLGFLLVFNSSKRMLMRVQKITETAAHIDQQNLSARVIVGANRDEIAHLASTLNHMLERIENSVRQLHTITDSLAHDLRSPMMAIRGKLELALLAETEGARLEPMAAALEEIDKLSNFLTQSLDVAEAHADALRLRKENIDLRQLVLSMVNLYEPSLAEHGIQLLLNAPGPIFIHADPGLIHRMFSNLLDNSIKHLSANTTVRIDLEIADDNCQLTISDDGPGFPPAILDRIFEKNVKGERSSGSGLGLAFVEAVVRAHGGRITATNLKPGSALAIELPRAPSKN
jgi:signal transduction histidine kinase